MVKHYYIRVLIEIINHYDIDLEQMDVETTFLHVDLKETIYIKKPEGFI